MVMTLPLTQIPRTIAAVTAALPDWTLAAPDRYLAHDHRDYEWGIPGHDVHLSIWDSASRAAVTITYTVGGSQVAHLVLTSTDQVWPWLRLVGAVVPTQAEVAEAVLAS